MPCESCSSQFTVFRRKRTCIECKRFYCNNCLTTSKRNPQSLLCQRCAIFSKRPLQHADLSQLKPKDLIFYLQSKHISTTGCVEKDELIRLVLNHIEQSDGGHNCDQQSPGSQKDSGGNSFDNIRQTCQNFFFNITENISDSLNAFDSKGTAKTPQDNNNGNTNGNGNGNVPQTRERRSNSTNSHIFDQPRISRREIPTYASSMSGSAPTPTTTPLSPPTSSNTTIVINERMQPQTVSSPTSPTRPSLSGVGVRQTNIPSHSSSEEQKSSTSSSLASPIISISSIASQGGPVPEIEEPDDDRPHLNLSAPKLSDCECSDDEIFTTFTARNSLTTRSVDVVTEVPVPNAISNPRTEPPPLPNLNSKLVIRDIDETSHSSYEELGAVGCNGSVISDDSKATEDSEAWQILEPHTSSNANSRESNEGAADSTQPTVIQNEEVVTAPPRKKLLRRRSERQRSAASDDGHSPTSTTALEHEHDSVVTELEAREELRRRSGTCRRCGKSNLRRYVEKMRRHLESSQLSEADIKREMTEFLAYLEDQTRSVDFSETETTASPLPIEHNNVAGSSGNDGGGQMVLSPTANVRHAPIFTEFVDDNDGIHVYGADAATSSIADHNARFVNLDDFDTIQELESLTVKQLKEVLMLHRVDYKGCCEKQELLERVQRLWKNLKSAPAVDKLPTDELCKICMDAPIECVILECGHMATCTNCGKVLSECPICRQYIVRVVRFFRA